MKTITTAEYQQQFGIVLAPDGTISQESRYGVASILRNVILENQCVTKREIHQRINSIFQPLNCDKENVIKFADECLKILKTLNEIVELYPQNGQHIWTATRPRWIKLDDNNAVLLGNISSSEVKLMPIDGFDTVRRFNPKQSELYVEEITLAKEIDRLPDLMKLKNKKEGELAEQIFESIKPVGCKIRVVGNKGNFFGSPRQLTGRWRFLSDVADGEYLGQQRFSDNQNDKRQRYLFVEKRNNKIRVVDLHDHDEWNLLLWASETKQYTVDGDLMRFNIPIPSVIEKIIRLFSSQQPHRWQWKLADKNLLLILQTYIS
ncbi:MAG: hypothetical protein LBQ66_03300 [Planctomycetaceae bacterium]|jgi:hypothetical protein|nr:hypothetical protein [Planctomycetaceae bacterium]